MNPNVALSSDLGKLAQTEVAYGCAIEVGIKGSNRQTRLKVVEHYVESADIVIDRNRFI